MGGSAGSGGDVSFARVDISLGGRGELGEARSREIEEVAKFLL